MRNWIIFQVLLITALGCDTASNIDPPDNSFFLKYYGGEGNQEGVDALLNADGTITLFGTTEALVGTNKLKQLYLVNIEQNGNVVWENTIATTNNAIAKDIELTNDGRLVVVADLNKSLSNSDILIMTLTLSGTLIDSASTGFTHGPLSPFAGQPSDETAVSVSQTNDGFIISGSTSNIDLKPTLSGSNDTRDALHLRYFNDLTIYPNTWRQAHGPGDADYGVKVIQVSPLQFYFIGYSNVINGDFNPYILGLGQNGETNAAYNFSIGNQGADEYLSSVVISPSQSGEGFFLLGVSVGATTDLYIVKMRKDLGFQTYKDDFSFDKNLTADLGVNANLKTSAYPSLSSGFLILANNKSSGVQNFYLNKIGSDGTPVWQNPIIFGGELDDQIGSVLELPDGSIGIIGTFAVGQDGEKKMTFIKVNKEGKFLK